MIILDIEGDHEARGNAPTRTGAAHNDENNDKKANEKI